MEESEVAASIMRNKSMDGLKTRLGLGRKISLIIILLQNISTFRRIDKISLFLTCYQ